MTTLPEQLTDFIFLVVNLTPEVNVPFAAYLLALVCFAIAYLVRKDFWRKAGLALIWTGLVGQTIFLILRWVEAGRAPMANQHESLLVMAWAVAALALSIGGTLVHERLMGWVAAVALLLLAIASFLDTSIQPLMPALRSNWLLYHVAACMFSYAALGIGAVAGGVALAAKDPDRISTLDDLQYRAISMGFLLLTAGVLLGSVWANQTWGSYWQWDAKETSSLVTWFVYAVTLHLWRGLHWRGKKFAYANLMGFLCVLFTYFGVNYLLVSLHAYAK
jgi:ABC-type transport system involved in cytochrome c biogenesis permease subunit